MTPMDLLKRMTDMDEDYISQAHKKQTKVVRFRRRLVFAAVIAIMVFAIGYDMLFGLSSIPFGSGVANNTEDNTEVNSEVNTEGNSEVAEYPNLDQQLELIANEMSVWAADLEYATGYYGCAITDLDHNGRLEVLVTSVEGSGYYSYSTFWEVSENMDALLDVKTNFVEGDSQPDISEFEWKIYDANNTYLVKDILNVSANEHLEVLSTLTLENGMLTTKGIASAHYLRTADAEEVHYYDENENEITKEEYEALESGKALSMEWMKIQELDENKENLIDLLKNSWGVFGK